MKLRHRHRFTEAIATLLCISLIILSSGCLAGSSRKVDVGADPGGSPGESTPSHVRTTSIDREKESYRIYSIVLNHKWDKGNVVVRSVTDRGLFQNDKWLENNVGKSFPEAVSDFKNANTKEIDIKELFDYSRKVSLIDQQEVKATIGGGEGWERFRKDHPGTSGIVTFSAVGFDSDGSHAVVNVSYLCASHCGNGSFYVLEKRDNDWTISKEIGTWMS